MTTTQLISANLSALCLLYLVYNHITFAKIKECYSMWFTREYWTDYNTVEFLSWTAKAIIIVPGLIFGISICGCTSLPWQPALHLFGPAKRNYYQHW